ncbi:MAG: hypothetical protein GY785_02380 [Gammaproteobacteria bacterium]|nr:hypothetical protein [Gammaproteobacteria bacterium]
MRSTIMLLTLTLLYGCASSQPSETEFVTRIGIIVGKEVVDLEAGGTDTRTNTSVSVGASSSGGFAIGLGFLLSPSSRSSDENPPVRYRVELMDGEQLTVFHESSLFEVEDCVEITSLVGDDQNPPIMKRIKGGCGAN